MWAYQDNQVAGATYYKYRQGIFDRIAAASDGRFTIKHYGLGEIVPYGENAAGVKVGLLDATETAGGEMLGLLGEVAGLMGTSGFPAGPTAVENMGWFYMGDGLKYATELWKEYGQITSYSAYAPEIWMSNKPLVTVADLKGLKFRAYGPCCQVFAKLGCSVVTIAGGELYTAVEKGIVDAYEIGGPDWNYTMGFQEVSTHVGTPGIHSPVGGGALSLVNHNKWKELPDSLKQLWTDEWLASALLDYVDSVHMDSLAMEKFKEYGTQFYTLSDELQAEFTRIARELCMEHSAKEPLYDEVFKNQAAFIKVFRETYFAVPRYSVFQ